MIKPFKNLGAFGKQSDILKWSAKCMKAISSSLGKYKKYAIANSLIGVSNLSKLNKHFLSIYGDIIQEAHSIHTQEPGILHELAIYYMRWAPDYHKPKRETIHLAKTLLTNSTSYYLFDNIWADLDYARLLAKYNKSDLVVILNELLVNYSKDREHGNICHRIGLEFEYRKEIRRAVAQQIEVLDRCIKYMLDGKNRAQLKDNIIKALFRVAKTYRHTLTLARGNSSRDFYIVRYSIS